MLSESFGRLLKAFTFFSSKRNEATQDSIPRWMGKIATAHGQIESKPSDAETWLPMEPADCFYAGDAVRAGHDSQAVLLFICPGYGKYLANLYEDTTITFMPAVLKKYFANRHYLKDDLDVIGIDSAALVRTHNDSQTEE